MSKHQLEQCVRSSLDQYFLDLNGSRPHDIYKMIVACVEKPMLEYLLERAQGNQSQAAESLGINSNTLRKKLQLCALLARRDSDAHCRTLEEHGIGRIDLLAVNLYPFTQTIAQADCTLENALEQIDIGGPAMLRAAAKNYRDVTVVTDPDDYETLLAEIRANGNAVSSQTRFRLAAKAFAHTAQYDGAITNYLTCLDEAPPH